MTMLGRGKRSSSDKPGKGRKDGKGGKGGKDVLEKDPEKDLTKEEAAEKAAQAEEKARKAAERAAKAEEAAEAARLAEEAAARAKEAARLAQIAADAASAEADEDEDETDEDGADEAVRSLEKKRGGRDGSEVESGGDDGSAGESVAATGISVDDETGEDDADDDEDEDSDDEDDDSDVDAKDDSEDDSDDADSEDEPVRSSERRGAPVLVIGILAVVAVALAAGGVFLTLKDREHRQVLDARRDAVAAAENAAKALSSYDYRTLDTDLKSASATTTGDLRGEFDKLAAQLRTQATQQQAVSTTTILKAGAVSAKQDEVVVLVYANRASATKNDTEARLPESLRIRMEMVEKDGKWLAQDLKVIS
ncbi:hypothetical protein [Actinomadura algeriensis]|uniref:Mce-associated membrane protein n=1 Tax=Actinomadura algeriensis TaxID=1679523 RepID=A0ABR9JN57_9ACTN|nr:hypothetical protein [Actinomadura algeriensis]MBE1531570.1 Mce-associated membrane protein [Actinomadura algeriensis]